MTLGKLLYLYEFPFPSLHTTKIANSHLATQSRSALSTSPSRPTGICSHDYYVATPRPSRGQWLRTAGVGNGPSSPLLSAFVSLPPLASARRGRWQRDRGFWASRARPERNRPRGGETTRGGPVGLRGLGRGPSPAAYRRAEEASAPRPRPSVCTATSPSALPPPGLSPPPPPSRAARPGRGGAVVYVQSAQSEWRPHALRSSAGWAGPPGTLRRRRRRNLLPCQRVRG